MADQRDLDRQLAELQASYVAALPGKLAELQHACERVLFNSSDRDAVVSAHRQAHSLAGSGATFGCEQVSTMARTLEALLKPLTTDSVVHVVEAARAAIPAALASLAEAVRAVGVAVQPGHK
jgi:chemotaxis protein histidine kinase CheA